MFNLVDQQNSDKAFAESVGALKANLAKKRPKKALKAAKKAKKTLTALLYGEVQALRAFQEFQDKLLKSMSVKNFRKFLGGKAKEPKIEILKRFSQQYGAAEGFGEEQAEILAIRLSRMKKMTLRQRFFPKKEKSNVSNDILKLYRQDPTMLAIELNKNKNLKLDRVPSIDNLRQSKIISLFFNLMIFEI